MGPKADHFKIGFAPPPLSYIATSATAAAATATTAATAAATADAATATADAAPATRVLGLPAEATVGSSLAISASISAEEIEQLEIEELALAGPPLRFVCNSLRLNNNLLASVAQLPSGAQCARRRRLTPGAA